MVDVRGELALRREPRTEGGLLAERGGDQLERDGPVEREIGGAVHDRHASPPRQRVDPVAGEDRADGELAERLRGEGGEPGAEPRVEVRPPGGRRANSGDELGVRRLLQHIAAGTGGDRRRAACGSSSIVTTTTRRGRVVVAQLADRRDRVAARHVEIDDDHAWVHAA